MLALTLLRLVYICFIPLLPQEAYFWNYSTKPDFSYYDHLPMAAYSIYIGTKIFGDHPFGIKFPSVILSLLTNIFLYRIALRSINASDEPDKYRFAFLVVLLFNLTTFAHIYAVITVPDSLLLFFWVVIMFAVVEFQISRKNRYLLLAGLALGLGLLSKYVAVAILPAIFICFLMNKQDRKVLYSPYPYLALLVGAIVFSPVIYWNAQQEWSSFIFQFGDRAAKMGLITLTYLGQLITSQLFILTPFVLFLLLKTTFHMIVKRPGEAKIRFYFLTGVFIIGGFILSSLRSLVKMNWLLPGYMGMIIATILLFKDRIHPGKKWLHAGVFSSAVFIILSYLIYVIPNVPLAEGNNWSGWKDASRRIYEIQSRSGGRNRCFIFSNSHKSASLLKFYLPDHQETYAQNILEEPALQYDIWGVPDSLQGKDALYVFSDRKEYGDYLEKIEEYFEEVSLVAEFEYKFLDSIPARKIFCYSAKNYHK